jgi:hypothetical protein
MSCRSSGPLARAMLQLAKTMPDIGLRPTSGIFLFGGYNQGAACRLHDFGSGFPNPVNFRLVRDSPHIVTDVAIPQPGLVEFPLAFLYHRRVLILHG